MQLPNEKLTTWEAFAVERARLRINSLKLVMTNGCFDLLHPGHIHFLQNARRLGDRLIVALNSDASVRSLKGPRRPVMGEFERAYALSALACVDYIGIFDQNHLAGEIRLVAPDVYSKAEDYTLESLDPRERLALTESAAKIVFLPFLPGFSTSDLIRKIARASAPEELK